MGLNIVPAYSTFRASSNLVDYDPIYPLSFGLDIDFKYNKSTITTGIFHYTNGASLEFETYDAEGNRLETMTQEIKTQTIALPVTFSYELAELNQFHFFAGAGVLVGYLYEEEFDGVPSDIFDDLFVGANAGIGFRYQLNSDWSLKFHPNLMYQLREELPEETNAWTIRTLAVNLNLGVSYRL